MKLLSIDTETTGLDPKSCCILEIGAVLFDPQPDVLNTKPGDVDRRWRTFEQLVLNQYIAGEPKGLAMNAEILQEVAGVKKTHRGISVPSQVTVKFRDFLREHGVTPDNPVTIVGKNYEGFDQKFLERLPGWSILSPYFERRVLDVGSLCFVPANGRISSLKECLEALGIRKETSHRALDDALDVATAVSRFFA